MIIAEINTHVTKAERNGFAASAVVTKEPWTSSPVISRILSLLKILLDSLQVFLNA